MEIAKNTVPKVRFYLPTPDTSITSVTWAKDGVEQSGTGGLPFTINGPAGYAEASLPYQNRECKIDVTWTFTIPGSPGTFTEVMSFRVITTYLSGREVAEISELSTEDAVKLEAGVRHIINAHCGQSFGKREDTLTVRGNGDKALMLPERLITLDKLVREMDDFTLYDTSVISDPGNDGTLGYRNFVVTGDGWFIKALHNSYTYSIKADHSDYISATGVIHYPYGRRGLYSDDAAFVVTGTWGWEAVPEPVKEAARLLVADYSSLDTTYRDKYLTSLTSPDWRIQFDSGAFRETGNVRADQLLSQFVVRRGWGVV